LVCSLSGLNGNRRQAQDVLGSFSPIASKLPLFLNNLAQKSKR